MTLNTPRFPHRPPTLTPGPCPRWALNMRQTGPRPSAGLFPAQPTEGPWMVDINTKKVLVSALRTRPSRVKASTARRISQTPVLSLPPWCPSPSPHSPCPLYAALGQQQKAFKYSLLQCHWPFPGEGQGDRAGGSGLPLCLSWTGGRPGGVRVQQGVPHSGHPALGSTRSICSSQPCPGTSFHVACLTQKPSPMLPQTAEAPGPAGPQRPCPTSPVTQQYGPRGLPAAALAASVGLPPCLSLTFTNEQGAEGGTGRTSPGDGRGGLAPEAQEENQVLTMQFLF